MDGWVDDLRFYVLFNSISIISGRCSDDNERLCAMELRLWLRRFYIEWGSNSVHQISRPALKPLSYRGSIGGRNGDLVYSPSGHFNVESTSDLNVETTLKYGWIWKLDGRWNDDVESTSITWRWFNVGASTLNQRWLSDVESTSYYLYPTFNSNHNTTFICNTDAVENEI